MTDVTPAGGPGAGGPGAGAGAAPDAPDAPGATGEPRKPRKAFLLVGVVLAVVVGIFLFTGLGTSQGSTGSGAPRPGSAVPSFTRQNVGPTGGSQVSVSSSGTNGRPLVLLFFGNWCPSCHQELPPLAAAVRAQERAGGPLARIRVVGVDSEDTVAHAKSFIHTAGVNFPVAYDFDTGVTSGLFYFDGDPYAVFVNGDGTISKVVRGDVLTPSSLSADERALIPSGT
ncbi:MAG TPA: TlpA disulfide reductase family protein [Acidimicrobiales bacterium]|jgi:peroxiredoxin|nr:TlpA disulfide reductase family protein [Acidimicrobiales bacterium]